MPTSYLIVLLIGVMVAGVAIVLTYWARWEALIAAVASIILVKLSGMGHMAWGSVWYWAAASAIAVAICLLLPSAVRNSRIGQPFFATGALVGAVIGILANTPAAVIVASAIGVILAGFAFGRMRAGQELGFPSKKFFNYLLAKGLPLVVAYSTIAIAMRSLAQQ